MTSEPGTASTPLEDYALLSDLRTGPLVSRDGSVDWLCLPRFDSPALFCALLGGPEDGRWRLGVVDGVVVGRRYRSDTFVLETRWESPTGSATVTDFLPPSSTQADLVRRVHCTGGTVRVEHDLRLRFDYARATPWVRCITRPDGSEVLVSLAGPDGLIVSGPRLHPLNGSEPDAEGAFTPRLGGTFPLAAGERLDWDLIWFPSYVEPPDPVEPERAEAEAVRFWSDWLLPATTDRPYGDLIRRSLLVLRGLTHSETGGIVAAPTASLPEHFGGGRNWDYRYTWLRDAALTIEVMVTHGLTRSASLWRDWLLRAVAGDAHRIKIMYGIAGERDLTERTLDHLAGYEGSRPVRIGNGAADQYQADVVGEVMIALATLRDAGVEEDSYSWGLQKNLLHFCEARFDHMDHGIWEMRGRPHYFTHGRVMLWAAFDQGVRAVETYGLTGPVDRWRELRDRLAAEVLERGFDPARGTFTQTYDNAEVDASLLQLPHTGFVAYDDPRMLGTVAAVEADLRGPSGLLHRYRTAAGFDGLEGEEYPFLLCSFWLVEQHAHTGRLAEAEQLMDQLAGYATDLGLLSEEYDPGSGRLAGNFPQAFSHLGLIRAADAIALARGDI